MRESSTYQAILDEGRAEGEARGRAEEAGALPIHLGTQRFGPPEAGVGVALEAMSDPDRLDRLARQLLNVSSWDELLHLS